MFRQGVKITIPPRGLPKIEAVGFSGAECLKATSDIEKALGGIAVKRQHTSDMYHERAEDIEIRETGD